jgi:acetyl esterase/lipase
MEPRVLGLWLSIFGLGLSAGCVVDDPGPGDTLPATVPALDPPITVNYRDLTANPVEDPGAYPDADLIDVYLPETIDETTAIFVFVHGGCWTGGTRGSIPAWVLHQVTRGYIVASVGYRLVHYDASGVAQNAFPAPVHDVKLAVRFMKAFSPLMGSSSRVIIGGVSAGGHLASFVGATPGDVEPVNIDPVLADYDAAVSAVINIVGPTDFTVFSQPGSEVLKACASQLLGCPQPTAENPFSCPPETDLAAASVLSWYDVTDPPTYFGFGGTDDWVPASQGAAGAMALHAATGEPLMAWYDLAETAWHDLDGRQLNMTALHGFMDAARDGQFDALRASFLP